MQSTALALFAVSAVFFLASGVMLALARRRPKADPRLDVTAQDLLHDLTKRGAAIIKVDVIDPSNLLLRSPRR